MKAINSTLIIVLLWGLTACEKETVLSVNQSSFSFSEKGGSKSIVLTANKSWAVSTDQSWCTVSPTHGDEASNIDVVISCNQNNTYEDRTCTITFTSAELSQTIVVSQESNRGLILSQTKYELTREAQKLIIDVKSNVDYSVEVDESSRSWIKYNSTKALSASSVVFDIEENYSYDSREGIVVFSQKDGSISSVVTVTQLETGLLEVSPATFTVDVEGEIIDVNVQTNSSYRVSIEDSASSWITQVDSKAVTSEVLHFWILPCDELTERTGIITIESEEQSQKVTVTQKSSASNDPIQFADIVAKYACVEKYDINKDGEVSYREAQSVTTLEHLFDNWNTVKSFDEIKYFTHVKELCGVFKGLQLLTSVTIPSFITEIGPAEFYSCSSLVSITLPETITSIGPFAFSHCESLQSIIIPESVSTIGMEAFTMCTSLEAVTLPPNIVAIPRGAFYSCSSLKNIIIPEAVTSIDEFAFMNCSMLESVDLSSNLRALCYQAFYGCDTLRDIILPVGLVSIGDECFRDCKSIKGIIIPETVETWGIGSFYNCSSLERVQVLSNLKYIPESTFYSCTMLRSLILSDTIERIDDNALYNCILNETDAKESVYHLPPSVLFIGDNNFTSVHHLILPSESIIEIRHDSFGIGTMLYVPNDKVDIYKVRTHWSLYAPHIFPIDSYPVKSADYVDLGLSVLWATMNVGASLPEEYGGMFAWGETHEKDDYSWRSYTHSEGENPRLTKYCTISNYGTIDNRTTLEPEDDAAHVIMGGDWRMPTYDELLELKSNCTWEPILYFGVPGVKVTSNITGYSDQWIFIPAAGVIYEEPQLGSVNYFMDKYAILWSSSLANGFDGQMDAYMLDYRLADRKFGTFNSWNSVRRCYGLSVRAVKKKL